MMTSEGLAYMKGYKEANEKQPSRSCRQVRQESHMMYKNLKTASPLVITSRKAWLTFRLPEDLFVALFGDPEDVSLRL